MGTNCKRLSSTYIWVLAMGRPMEIVSSPGLILQTLDQIVVSVEPYIFQREAPFDNNCRARERGSASPPQSILRRGFPCQPAASSRCQVTGVACITVAYE